MKRQKQNILENLIYLIIWLVVFIVPIFGIQENGKTDWQQVGFYWKRVLPFLILFLINNYFLIPYFLLRKKLWWYLLTICITCVFLFMIPRFVLPRENFQGQPPKHMPQHWDLPADSIYTHSLPPSISGKGRPPEAHSTPPQFKDRRFFPPDNRPPGMHLPFRLIPIVNDWMLAIVIIGLNIAIRLLFKSIRDDRQIKELESHTLQAELNYLKAQINPHVFYEYIK